MANQKKKSKKNSSSGSRNALGRGLGALFGEETLAQDDNWLDSARSGEKVRLLFIHDISPMQNQPRSDFDDEAMQELAESIKEHGVLQPILVNREDDHYRIIAGERRWRASRMAGLTEIPAIVRDLKEIEALQQSIVENIQREDLNPMEEAYAFQRLMDEYGMTQEALAKSMGRSRSAVANAMRLTALPAEIQNDIKQGLLTQGHARALLGLKEEGDQLKLADRIVREGLNVRQTEQAVKLMQLPKGKKKTNDDDENSAYALSIKAVETDLSKLFGSKVHLKDRDGRGKIVIPYKNPEDLQRIMELLQ